MPLTRKAVASIAGKASWKKSGLTGARKRALLKAQRIARQTRKIKRSTGKSFKRSFEGEIKASTQKRVMEGQVSFKQIGATKTAASARTGKRASLLRKARKSK